MLSALGIAIAAYAIYALCSPNLPTLKSRRWLYGTGFLSGVLNGSYNLPGPPIILYGNSQKWTQETFKSNLSGFFWGNAAMVVLGHGLQNRFSEMVLHQYVLAVPSLVLGLYAGIGLSKFFNPRVFRRIVLGILVIIGFQIFILGVQS